MRIYLTKVKCKSCITFVYPTNDDSDDYDSVRILAQRRFSFNTRFLDAKKTRFIVVIYRQQVFKIYENKKKIFRRKLYKHYSKHMLFNGKKMPRIILKNFRL